MMNRLTRSIAVLAIASAPHVARAGVPVIDVASLAQALLEVAALGEQLEQLYLQYKQMEQQYKAVTEGRGLGAILNDPTLQNYIPKEAREVLTKVNSNGYSGLTGSAKAMRDAAMIYNCMDVASGAERNRCQAELARPYQYRSYYDDAMARAGDRTKQIQALMERAGSTSDAKEIAEVQARIGAEGALLQHELSQINLMRGMADADAKIAESQAREAQREAASRKGLLFAPAGAP